MGRKRFKKLGILVGCSNKSKLNYDKDCSLEIRKFSDGSKSIVKVKNQSI